MCSSYPKIYTFWIYLQKVQIKVVDRITHVKNNQKEKSNKEKINEKAHTKHQTNKTQQLEKQQIWSEDYEVFAWVTPLLVAIQRGEAHPSLSQNA